MQQIPEIFREYIAMWQNYVNFDARTNVRGYWMAFLWNAVAGTLLGMLSPSLGSLYGLAALIPGVAIAVRRLRDAGKPWQYIFFLLIPIAGVVLLIIWLTTASVPDDGKPVV